MRQTEHGGFALAEAVKKAYADGLDDYHMTALVSRSHRRIQDGDSVVFCCRRGEREIELTEMFTDPAFSVVPRKQLHDLDFVLLTQYHEKFRHLPIAFPPYKVDLPLAQALSKAGKTQFHCAESEKFAHVTYFFNGGSNDRFAGETDGCIPSPKGLPFDAVPGLSLPEVAKTVEDALGRYDFIVVNFANGDVIGHTSNTEAKLEACRAVSGNLESVVAKALMREYVVIVTADHGNIEKLYTENGTPDVAHTANLVPFMLLDPNDPDETIRLRDGSLCDVAPTVLDIMGVEKPAQMTGSKLTSARDWGKNRKVLLVILDGWGLGSGDENDAIFLASTPYWDSLVSLSPWCRLNASGAYVGLAPGKAGNSEAGHLNLGAGRCVVQDDIRIDKAIEDGSFEVNPVLLRSIGKAKEKDAALHLITYLTYNSSHGSMEYAAAAAKMAKAQDLRNVYLHIIFDGRSTEPGSAPRLLMDLENKLQDIGTGHIVDGIGRGFALDRDRNYERVKQAYDMMVEGKGRAY
jgi:2,3-bisphosphoglycerate-independent phosphoglycerate mutase